jgi:hypothetical protein
MMSIEAEWSYNDSKADECTMNIQDNNTVTIQRRITIPDTFTFWFINRDGLGAVKVNELLERNINDRDINITTDE